MKKLSFLAIMLALTVSCIKEKNIKVPADKWNGYNKYLKMGEQTHDLKVGRHLVVGTAIYGLDDNANFYVTYDCSSTEWSIQATHLFAGDKKFMPLNRKQQPRVNFFPHSSWHNPKVETFTYRIPLTSLPPAEEPGFAVAAQCVVTRNTKCHDEARIAWADGDFKFTDKGTGWYDVFYFNQIENQYVIIYCIALAQDSLRLFHLDITNNSAELTYTEYVGNTSGSYDAAAYDIDSGLFFFVKTETNELWVNSINDEDSSFVSGQLSGTALSATFYDGIFYYVDDQSNTIRGVSFNSNMAIESDHVLDTIPGTITVNDIAMNPEGTLLYISGGLNQGPTQLFTWNTGTGDFCSSNCTLYNNAQIACGSDGLLYAISPFDEEGELSEVVIIDIESDSLTVIEDEIIIIEDPFSDISGGPAM